MRCSTVLLTGLVLLTLGPGAVHGQDANDLNGTWIVTSWTGQDGQTDAEPQRGLFLFTITRADGGSYSMMFVLGDEARAEYAGESMTDAEKLSAYDSFVANSGRLTVEGGTLTYEAYMAKDPNYMGDWEENGATADWAVDDETLTLTFTSDFMEGTTATFRRPRRD